MGDGHLVLGKILDESMLTTSDLEAIQEICSSINQSTVKLYHRVLISGTVYTTSSYMRSKFRKDDILCLKRNDQKYFGSAKQYISFCASNCTECLKPCQHVAIVSHFIEIPTNISTDNLTGATLKHIHCVQPTRHVMYI